METKAASAPVAGRAGVLARLPSDVPLLFCVLVWGANFTATKYALTHAFAPLAFAALRFSLATSAFSGIVAAREKTIRVDRRSLAVLVGAGAVVILANQISFIVAVHLATASTVSLLFGTLPIFAALFQRERFDRRHWLAAGISFAGVALVAAGASGGLSGDLGGILLGLAAPATWAFYSVLAHPYVTRYSSLRVNTIVCMATCVPLLPIASPWLADEHWSAVSALAWGALLFSSLPAYAFTNFIWLVVIERVGTARAAIYANLQPFLGAVFAVLLLSERLHAPQIVGGAVIACGIVLARWRRPLDAPSLD